MKFGVIGTGFMAEKMSSTWINIDDVQCYAIAGRNYERTKEMASKFGYKKLYRSCEDLVRDKDVEIVYIATPHSMHYEQMKICLNAGKSVLCEKPFTANATQAKNIFKLAQEKNLFISEAFWTKCLPIQKTVKKLLSDTIIGSPSMIIAHIGGMLEDQERINKLEMAGGALLDIGVYPITFALQNFGNDFTEVKGESILSKTGVDSKDVITITWDDGKIAVLTCSSSCITKKIGMICGSKGMLLFDNINNPTKIEVYDQNQNCIQTINSPEQINGYEYEIIEVIKSIKEGKKECEKIPHSETIRLLEITDELRKQWGVIYPFD